MAVENKNVRRVQGVDRTALVNELKTKMLGFASTDGSLGFKDSVGTMHYYTEEGGNASFNNLNLACFGGSTGYLAIDDQGNVILSTSDGGSAAMSTGVVSFAGLSINTDNTKFNVGAVKAFFVDNTTPETPIVSYESFAAQDAITVTGMASQNATYIAIDVDGVIHQSADPYTPEQTRSWIPLGVVVHSNRTNVNAINNQVNTTLNPTNQLADFADALGDFNINGNVITANGSNMQINKSGGTIFRNGGNFVTNPNSPHIVSLAGLTAPSTLRYRTQTGTEYSDTNAIDGQYYDVGGTRTSIPSASNWTIQRAYLFPSNLIRIQYGQTLYASKTDAINAIGTENFVTEQNANENGILIAYIVLVKNATALNNSTQATIINVGKFGSILGAGSASIDTLQTAYNNSITPEIVTNSALGALSIKRGSASDTDIVFEVVNGSGVTKFAIDGNGIVQSGNVPVSRLSGTADYLAAFDGSGNGTSISKSTFALASHNHNGVYQPIDNDLTAIAALTGTSGFLKKTATDTWTLDTSTYLTAVTGDTTSRTANTVYAAPDGVAGTATFRSLVAADIPNLSTTKLTSGTLGVARGGTGKSSWTAFGVPYASATTTLTELTPNTSTTQMYLSMTGSGSAGLAPVWSTISELWNGTNKVIYVDSQGGGWENWSARGFGIFSDTDDNAIENLLTVTKGSARTRVFAIDSVGLNTYLYDQDNLILEDTEDNTDYTSLIIRKSRGGRDTFPYSPGPTIGDVLGKIKFQGGSSGGWVPAFDISVTYAASIVNYVPSNYALNRYDGVSVYSCDYRGRHAFSAPSDYASSSNYDALVRFIGVSNDQNGSIAFDSSSNSRIWSRQTSNLLLEIGSNIFYDGTTYRQRVGSASFGASLINVGASMIDFRFSDPVVTNNGATSVYSSMRVYPTYTQVYNTGLITPVLAVGDGTLNGGYDVYVKKNSGPASIVASAVGSEYHASVVSWSDIGHIAQVSTATTDTFSVFGATNGFTALYSNASKPFYIGSYLTQDVYFGSNNLVRMSLFNNGLFGVGVGSTPSEGLVEFKCATANYAQLVLTSTDTHTADVGPELSFFGKNIAGTQTSFGAFKFNAITTSVNNQTKAIISIIGSSGEMDIAEFWPTGVALRSTSTGITPKLFLYNSANTYATTLRSGSITTDIDFILPTSTGTNGQVLTTNGSGTLSWTTASGGNIKSAELDPTETSWSSNTNYNYTVTVTGAAVGNAVIINPNSTLNSDLLGADTNWLARGYVSAANTVTINVRVATYVSISTASRILITTVGA